MHRSVSQLLKYTSCSEQYRLMYVDKPDLPYRPAAWLAQGTAYHETIREWEGSGRYLPFAFDERYYYFYDLEIAKMRAKEPDLYKWLRAISKKPEVDIEERRNKGLEQVLSYVEYVKTNLYFIKDIDEYTLALEVPFELDIGNTKVKGAIDMIIDREVGVEVRDLKTGNRESQFLQLGIYKLAVEKIFGWKVVGASFFYAKDSKVVGLTARDLARYDEPYLTQLFTSLDAAVENKIYIPNPGGHCTMCPVKKFCREMGD